MRVSTSVRTALASMLVIAAACSDAPTAPTAAVATTSELAFAKGGNGGTTQESATFTINPGQPTVLYLGRFEIDIPANALCVASSGYGRPYWNLPCTPETKAQNFTATWSVTDGAASISFNKDVRFDPAKRVYIILKVVGQVKNTDALLWYDRDAKSWVDEGTYDPQMKTYRANGGTLMWRRLKHFSGYNVGAGECDPSVDPSCGGEVLPPQF